MNTKKYMHMIHNILMNVVPGKNKLQSFSNEIYAMLSYCSFLFCILDYRVRRKKRALWEFTKQARLMGLRKKNFILCVWKKERIIWELFTILVKLFDKVTQWKDRYASPYTHYPRRRTSVEEGKLLLCN